MRVHFDEKADAIYLRFDESKIVGSEEVHPGIILDFNERNEVVGVEEAARLRQLGAERPERRIGERGRDLRRRTRRGTERGDRDADNEPERPRKIQECSAQVARGGPRRTRQ